MLLIRATDPHMAKLSMRKVSIYLPREQPPAQHLERLSRQLDAVLNGPAERGEQAASLSPMLGASRSLQHQLNMADLYNREALMRLAR